MGKVIEVIVYPVCISVLNPYVLGATNDGIRCTKLYQQDLCVSLTADCSKLKCTLIRSCLIVG